MYLIDTNIWLERLLDQDRGNEVGLLLASIPATNLLVTDFTFHSIGVILSRLGQKDAFLLFVQDVFIDHGVGLISLEPTQMHRVMDVMTQFALDFDDAYQYVAAEMVNAPIVSFDRDFDRTSQGKMTPAEVLSSL